MVEILGKAWVWLLAASSSSCLVSQGAFAVVIAGEHDGGRQGLQSSGTRGDDAFCELLQDGVEASQSPGDRPAQAGEFSLQNRVWV